MKPRRIVAVIAAAALLAGGVSWAKGVWWPGRPFEADAWNARGSRGDHVAAEMADRFVARSTLTGMRRAEVLRLLGMPPETSHFSQWDLVYWLGPERGFIGIDSEWLAVRFDADGRVADYRIVRD